MTFKTAKVCMITAILLTGCEVGSKAKNKPALRTNSAAPAAAPTKAEPPAAPQQDNNAQAENVKTVKPLGYLVDVNEVTDSQLSQIPAMTPDVKKLIKDLRPFLDIAEFDDELDLLNIPPKKRMALYEHIFMRVDANTSPVEEFLFIPGMSKKMAFKIENGRPYANTAELKATLLDSYKGDKAQKILQYFSVSKPE